MTYPPQGPYGYQVPYQVQPAPERPQQVLTAAILMVAIGVIGLLMLLTSLLDVAALGALGGGLSFAGCLGPILHVAVGVLAIFVLRGQHGPRVAVYVVGGAAALCDGFSAVMSMITASELADYNSGPPAVLVFLSIIVTLVMCATVAAIALLATGRANAWFTAMRQRPPIAPQQWA
ncbi:hypothetical protein [Phytomonospora endophytica]|uniref:Uncharacterized protein n=1 Tax=Phytomonospora endophytica TaxID=714109 RepID=A0A841FVD3_9ACTN|nr:hypothetical protein [Phytomonospora endophytica]MBB6039966.1 hypothetical protein [Phytomonospora endophytica]GIG69828.1 hypothetical protein Pen01_61230 [Phytomonospora endophytica]